MILTRTEFAEYFDNLGPGLGNDDSGLWVPEQYLSLTCNWFVSTRPVALMTEYGPRKLEFWVWVENNMKGKVCCYSSSEDEEWWGFTDKNDILLFVLRWA